MPQGELLCPAARGTSSKGTQASSVTKLICGPGHITQPRELCCLRLENMHSKRNNFMCPFLRLESSDPFTSARQDPWWISEVTGCWGPLGRLRPWGFTRCPSHLAVTSKSMLYEVYCVFLCKTFTRRRVPGGLSGLSVYLPLRFMISGFWDCVLRWAL